MTLFLRHSDEPPPTGDSHAPPAGRTPSPGGEEREGGGARGKLLLTLFPFAVVLVFLLLEGWLRGRP